MGKSKNARGGAKRGSTSVQQFITYAIVRAIRQIYSRYSPEREAVLDAAKVKIPQVKKNGELSTRYLVFYRCADCGELTKHPDVHHDPPVGKMPWFPYAPGTLEAWVESLFCAAEKLVVLCSECHKKRHKERE